MTIDSPQCKAHESQQLILLPKPPGYQRRWSSLALARGWGQLPAQRRFVQGFPRPGRRAVVQAQAAGSRQGPQQEGRCVDSIPASAT